MVRLDRENCIDRVKCLAINLRYGKGCSRKGRWEVTVSFSVYRIVLAIAAAAVVACFFTIITATADPVEFSARIIGAQCSQQAWPYYETHCLRDRRQSDARPARVVSTERW